MENYPIVLFALGIFGAFPTASEAFSQGSFDDLDYVNFMIDEFFFLNITSIGKDLIPDQDECGFACIETPSCFSYNVAASPDINGKLLCELLPSDKYNNSDKFLPNQFFHHFSIASPCSSWPCKNNGKCVSLYQEKNYKCACKEGFTGQNCETDINECDSSPCLNNGTCTDKVNGFDCSCPPGFAGDRCNKTACEALGVADINKVPDARMTASTTYSSSYEPYYGRLDSSRGSQRWSPKTTSNRSDYLQVDMGVEHSVCAVATQRRSSDYTKTYYLQFSLNGVTWNIYKENNAQKVFPGSTFNLSVEQASLDPVVKARFIRFYPITYKGWPDLSVEIYVKN